jgi:hypothetical protein
MDATLSFTPTSLVVPVRTDTAQDTYRKWLWWKQREGCDTRRARDPQRDGGRRAPLDDFENAGRVVGREVDGAVVVPCAAFAERSSQIEVTGPPLASHV